MNQMTTLIHHSEFNVIISVNLWLSYTVSFLHSLSLVLSEISSESESEILY